MVPLPPAPPPPPPPPASIPPLHKPGNIYSTPSTTQNAPIRNYTVQNSASNDTLVQEDSISNEVDNYENDDGVIDYEPPHDYNENDDNDCSLDRKDNDSESNYSSHIETAIDYDQTNTFTSNKTSMSTFNNKQTANSAPNNNNNLILMMLNSGNKGTNASPLTPRQIKQRNSAKRNSIPRSSSSNPSPANQSPANLSSHHSVVNLTPTQQRDLAFLQTQKFDTEFMQTTKDLFLKYPNAKISISVTVSTTQTSPNHPSIQQQTQTNRQIEINRDMFEKICAFQTQKVQPQTPIRTTSISTASSSNNNCNYNSISSSSSSPNSSSSSSSAYDSSSMPSECAPPMPATPNAPSLKNDDLNEAIRKAAAEHMLKRQSSANSINCNQDTNSSTRASSQTNINSGHVSQLKQQLNQSCILPSAAVKNELERAIENRLKRTNLQNAENSATNVTPSSFLNKRNVPRDPPPPLPACALNKNSFVSSTVPPPPPPPQAELGSPSQSTLSNNSANSFPPPPSPTVLHRLSNIDISGSVSNKNGPISPIPPPPPPPPPLPNTTAPVAKEMTQQITPTAPVQARTNNVKSIVNNYQQSQIQLLDPRSSSDFSELIAKKAAEKRAKFQENKPSANAVTFQPDGSKVFTASSTNINNTNQTKQSNSIENQAKPKIYTTSKTNTTTTTTTPPLVNSLKKQSSTESSNSISNHTVTPSKLLLGNAQQSSSQITATTTTSNSGK